MVIFPFIGALEWPQFMCGFVWCSIHAIYGAVRTMATRVPTAAAHHYDCAASTLTLHNFHSRHFLSRFFSQSSDDVNLNHIALLILQIIGVNAVAVLTAVHSCVADRFRGTFTRLWCSTVEALCECIETTWVIRIECIPWQRCR